jgi:hypothetical protein
VQNLLSFSFLSKNVKTKISVTIILHIVLYGCETWSLTVRDKHRLRVFKYGVLNNTFGHKRGEVMGECRRLHNDYLYDLYSSPTVIQVIKLRIMRWKGHMASMGDGRGTYSILV